MTKKSSLLTAVICLSLMFCQAAGAKNRTIPQKTNGNKFGFLSAGEDDYKQIYGYGAKWARPHPGPFLWDSMQSESGAAFDFTLADDAVKKYEKKKIAVLATLWPFADWDQLAGADPASCAVSENDQFLADAREEEGKGGGDSYLPLYRCKPTDWAAYENWVKAVVERYDGDRKGDMPGLKIPIRYWEVMNEPDLEGENTLDFWKGNASDYVELLTRTHTAVKEADPSAKVLIAGAAGGSDEFLNFYRGVFQDETARNSFDIANVHCISNDSYESFNVEPYKNMLAEFNLDGKPVWVTEAEAIVSEDAAANYSQTYASVRSALAFGARKIFFTRYGFPDTDRHTRKRYKAIKKL